MEDSEKTTDKLIERDPAGDVTAGDAPANAVPEVTDDSASKGADSKNRDLSADHVVAEADGGTLDAEDVEPEIRGESSADAMPVEPQPDAGLGDATGAVDESAEAEDSAPEAPVGDRGPLEEDLDDDDEIKMDWYILKVQSNRENTICDALRRRVAVAGLDEYFGDIMVPTEDVAEFKNGKKKIVKRKLYPGYIVVHMSINDDTWFLVRETPGIGDFTGAQGKPSPMLSHEVDRIVKAAHPDAEDGEHVRTSIPFALGDRVRIKEGTFENFEGDVEGIDEANGRVTVMINIFGRSTPFEAEHWQIESV